MGHNTTSTLIFVGLARLPLPSVAVEQTLAVEVEIELPAGRILAVSSTLQLPGLARLLREILVGECVGDAGKALLELEVRYSAPFTTAICAAVKRALQRASIDRSSAVPAAAPAAASTRSRHDALAAV